MSRQILIIIFFSSASLSGAPLPGFVPAGTAYPAPIAQTLPGFFKPIFFASGVGSKYYIIVEIFKPTNIIALVSTKVVRKF